MLQSRRSVLSAIGLAAGITAITQLAKPAFAQHPVPPPIQPKPECAYGFGWAATDSCTETNGHESSVEHHFANGSGKAMRDGQRASHRYDAFKPKRNTLVNVSQESTSHRKIGQAD